MDHDRRAQLLTEAEVQHKGGKAGAKGYRYQDRVVVFELLSGGLLALRDRSKWPTLYMQEAKDSFTDDLHVRLHSRRHVQIKSKNGLSWEAALRSQLEKEKELHPHAILELCVHDRALQESLDRNKADWGLGHVVVTCVPFEMMRRAYRRRPIQDMMKPFLQTPIGPYSYQNFWHHLLGVWVDELETSSTLLAYFEHCALTNDGRMKALDFADVDVSSAVERWNGKQGALIFSADELSLKVKIPGTPFGDLVLLIDRLPTEIWSRDVITSPWDLTNALQQFDPA